MSLVDTSPFLAARLPLVLTSVTPSLCRNKEFALELQVMQVQFTDSSSARQLLGRQGCGKIRHLSGKVLWVQEKIKDGESHVGTDTNSMECKWHRHQGASKEAIESSHVRDWCDVHRNMWTCWRSRALRAADQHSYVKRCLQACRGNYAHDNHAGPWTNWHSGTGPGGVLSSKPRL